MAGVEVCRCRWWEGWRGGRGYVYVNDGCRAAQGDILYISMGFGMKYYT